MEMHNSRLFFVCIVLVTVVGEISIQLPTPLHDSAISRIYDPVQLQSEATTVVVSNLTLAKECRLICTFDNTINMSAFYFKPSEESTVVNVPVPRFRDGPHTITIRVFDGNSEVQIDFAEVQIEVREGWNDGELRDPSCPLCEFTTDWTKDHINDWIILFNNFTLPSKDHWSDEQIQSGFDLLEIGSWEGRCASFFA
jgi:hypothetical protein